MKPIRSSFYILRGCGPFTLYKLVHPKCMCALTKSDDPDEMPQNGFSEKKYKKFYLEIISCDSSMYTMDYLKLFEI